MLQTMTGKIYTRIGDKGKTSLVDGSLVDKFALRVEAYGNIDEANAWVGVACTAVTDVRLREILVFLGHRFFNCSSSVATPLEQNHTAVSVSEEDVRFVESVIDELSAGLPPLSGFVLNGGCQAAGYMHLARTVVRRAERQVCHLRALEAVDPLVLKFINRSSDFSLSVRAMPIT